VKRGLPYPKGQARTLVACDQAGFSRHSVMLWSHAEQYKRTPPGSIWTYRHFVHASPYAPAYQRSHSLNSRGYRVLNSRPQSQPQSVES